MWFGVLDERGRMYSIGTEVASQLPRGWRVIELGEGFDPSDKEWDASAQAFVSTVTVLPTPEETAAVLVGRIRARLGVLSRERDIEAALALALRGDEEA